MSDGVASDPLALVERAIERVVSRLIPADALAESGDMPADELLATALGDRLAQMIADEDEQLEPEAAPESLTHFQQLLDRNTTVAAALGACDCWGRHPDCPFCAGAGKPGWALPDERLFAAYVQPAVDALRPRRPAPRPETQTTNGQPTTGA